MAQDPGSEIMGKLQGLMAGVEMRLADALSSGSDLIQTAKIYEAGKFYTKPERAAAVIRDNRMTFSIAVNKPIDLKSLNIGWSFAINTHKTNYAGLNHGKFNPQYNSTQKATDDIDAAFNAAKNPRLCINHHQLLRAAEIYCIIPMYMIRKLMVHINGALVGEIPPGNIQETVPHWFTFISVMFNTFDRPKPLSLDQPFTFPNKADGSSEKMYFWWNTLVHDCLLRYDMDYTASSQTQNTYYHCFFPIGKYFEQHFGHPTRWLTWGNNMDIDIEFQPVETILEYSLSLNSAIYDKADTGFTPVSGSNLPQYVPGPFGLCEYMVIADQNGAMFNELNALIIALSPLVYRRPYYEQYIQLYQKVQRGQPFNIPFQTSRRPRYIILRCIQQKPRIETTNKYKNYTTPWQFRWIPFDKVRCQLNVNYLTQNYFFEEIKFDNTRGDGLDGTWHMWHQFQEIIGAAHHRRNSMKPITFKEWYSSWPCFIFRMDCAPAAAIVIDQKLGYGTDTFNVNLQITADSGVDNDLDDKNVYWALTLVSEDMTTIDQAGQFRFNNRPDMTEPFSSARPIAEQRGYQIALSGSLINLLTNISQGPTNPGSSNIGFNGGVSGTV